MFLEQGFKGKHHWYHYFGGTLLIFFLFLAAQGFVAVFLEYHAHPVSLMNASLPEVMKATGLSENFIVFLLLASFVFASVGIYLAVRFIHQRSFKSLITPFQKINWRKYFFSFGLMSSFIIFSTIISYYFYPEDLLFQFELFPFLILLIISIFLIPIQAGFEELFFRGYLLQGLGVIFRNRWAPLILTSVLFGLMHASNPEVDQLGESLLIYYIGTGLFMGIITLMDDSLELALGFHTANNFIQILLITSDYSVFQSPSILKDLSKPTEAWSEILFPLLILYPLLILIFSRKYKWKNWKEKLSGSVQPIPPENFPQV